MAIDSWIPNRTSGPAPIAGELITDYRARLAHEQTQAVERKRLELAEQASVLNAPDVRIRIWERLHGVALPRDPNHRLLHVIAADTGLMLDQVYEEQRARVAAVTRDSKPVVPPAASPPAA
jgi:hypothetical protein